MSSILQVEICAKFPWLARSVTPSARFEDISKRFSKLVEQERRKKDTELHVILVGNKYDKFSSESNEKKRVINNFLRALAVTLRGSLVQVIIVIVSFKTINQNLKILNKLIKLLKGFS